MAFKQFVQGWRALKQHVRRARNRTVGTVAVTWLWLIKPFPFLYFLAPGRLRGIVTHWTRGMLWIAASTRLHRVLADQPCLPRMPATFEPKAEVDDAFRLTEHQVRTFFENGFLAPLTLCSPEEMAEILEEMERQTDMSNDFTVSKAYGIRTGRDRHLDCPAVFDLATRAAVGQSVAQLMGPDLLLWRTQLVPKPPGGQETAWHQVSTFTMSGTSLRPVLEPPDRDELFNVTAWIALEDVDEDNGCLMYYRGSHREPMHTMRLGVGQRFGVKAVFELEFDQDPQRVMTCPLKAGQFVIFHERTIHGALPNNSKTRSRRGMNCRICRPNVRVYPNMEMQSGFTFHETYSLANWGAVLLHGEDRYQLNRYAKIEADQPQLVRAG